MDAMDESPDEPLVPEVPEVGGNGKTYRPRGYQLEMLEESLRQNIIVAMDTGSGKTQIAVLRIIAELEISGPSKLVWFLAPTVALSLQQHAVISSQIPAVKTRVLTGLDNVERWTSQIVWNTVLQDVRVVVSTHAVLADALSHGFVTMGKLALIVFDEAHHCMRRHPANKIMQGHYHPTREKFGHNAVPRILGLTASPIVRSNKKELETIETNLNAVCITPRTNRSELLEHVHRPVLERIQYPACDPEQHGAGSQLLGPLISCIRSYDMRHDPYIEMLRKQPGKEEEADAAAMSGKTYCLEQLTKFREQCIHIYEELGGWATDYLIVSSIAQLENSVDTKAGLTKLARQERAHMVKVLLTIPPYDESSTQFHVSAKLETLIRFLEKMDHPQFSGLLFVKRRATVKVMSQLLCVHPNTQDRFRTAPYVGWSNNSGRKDAIGDLLTRGGQRDTLAEFKSGLKNLIVATDVLEEGLDVSSCSLVICYDRPANLKSFVQRRGRARHHESTYAIMTATDDELQNLDKWQALEQVMIEAYLDEQRRMREASTIEDVVEVVPDCLEVPSTSARLFAEDIMSHLYHFCDILPSDQYTDNRPTFTFHENAQGLIQSVVTLPNSVHPDVRRAEGQKWWQTEHAARKEAAFQAYKALWEHGLLNDNLLPLTKKPELDLTTETVEKPKEVIAKDSSGTKAVVECSEQYDPFVDLAEAWSSTGTSVNLYQYDIIFSHEGTRYEVWRMSISLPMEVSMPEAIPLYWKPDTTLLATFAPPRLISVSLETLNLMRETTALFLQAPTSRPLPGDRDFIALFTPSIPPDDLPGWLCENEGSERALDFYERGQASPLGIIRDMAAWDKKGIFHRWVVTPGEDGEEDRIDCEYGSGPKRRNFLQPRTATEAAEDGEIGAPKIRLGLAETCTVGRLPASQAEFGLLISALLDQIETSLVVRKVNETVLPSIGFNDLGHILTAITTPFAHPTNHYQVYEFFGDSILKFTVASHLFFRQPTWHEGYLTESFAGIVGNKRLSRASLDAGLDNFILKKRFTPRRWDVPLISAKLDTGIVPARREISSKVLADVVESLIGAAYLDGGMRQAQRCIHRFLPEVDFFTEDIGSSELMTSASTGNSNLIDQSRLSRVIGYTFNDFSLLTEALTHPSCEHDTTTQSYQRLEYLGDAVLDMVIVQVLISHPAPLTQGELTLLKHALVNANLLAFFCMNHGAPETQIDIMQTDGANPDFTSHQEDLHLWQFLRFNSAAIAAARDLCIENYHAKRERISYAIEHAGFFPWELLSQLNPDKFLSDIVESVIAAIFIDSGGNLEPCHAFLERIGLLGYLNRILQEGVNVVHPRNAAQEVVRFQGTLVFKSQRIELPDGSATYTCSVTLNKEEVASIEGCVSAEEAEVRVSYLVIRKVMSERGSS